jgi:septal ring factor EnvC (AmiA/AmiB activator)
MRRVREQPRRVAARLTVGFFVLVAAAAVGSALASDRSTRPTEPPLRLERREQLLREQRAQIDRLTAQAEQLGSDLRMARRRARTRARHNERLRHQLQDTRRNLARARNQ